LTEQAIWALNVVGDHDESEVDGRERVDDLDESSSSSSEVDEIDVVLKRGVVCDEVEAILTRGTVGVGGMGEIISGTWGKSIVVEVPDDVLSMRTAPG